MTLRRLLIVLAACALAAHAQAQTTPAPAAQHNHDHDTPKPGAGPAGALSPEAYVDRVLLGAPVNLRPATGVIRWKNDFTWDTLKAGTNRLVCFDRSDEDRRNAFAVQCTSLGNLPRVAQNRKFRAESKTNEEEQAKVAAAEKNGTRVKPEYGSPWINTNGPDANTLRTHTTIAVPGATAQSLGLPDNNKQTGAWVMEGGTSSAHIMLPGQ